MKQIVFCNNCGSQLKRYETKTKSYFCNIPCKAEWQVKQRESLGITKDWLIEQYFKLGKTCNDIAKEVGRNPKRVWEWFNDYGIEIKGRGQDKRQHFKSGHKVCVGRVLSDSTKQKIREARIRDKHVPYLNKDGVHWLKGKKGSETPNFKGGRTPERQAVYSSLEWKDLVKKVWSRDNATCRNCGKRHNTKEHRGKFDIHHIVSFQVVEFRYNLDNLILLCKSCHKWVHSKQNVEGKFLSNP